MTTKIHLSDWEAIQTELSRFGTTGKVTTDETSIRVEFGSAYIEVTKDESITTGMPLHDLKHDGEEPLKIDHDNGSITVETDTLQYTFRRP